MVLFHIYLRLGEEAKESSGTVLELSLALDMPENVY